MISTIAVAAMLTIAVIGASAVSTQVGPWYRNLRKPAWTPPDWVFGPAWTIILVLAASSGVLAWTEASGEGSHIHIAALFGVNILLFLLWSPLFFSLRRPDWALIEAVFLWLSVAALMGGLWRHSHLSSWLLLPYLAWVTFAIFLNLTIVRMNPPFSRPAQG